MPNNVYKTTQQWLKNCKYIIYTGTLEDQKTRQNLQVFPEQREQKVFLEQHLFNNLNII